MRNARGEHGAHDPGESIPLLPQEKPSNAPRNYNSLDIRTDHRPRRHAVWNCVIFCIAENLLNLDFLLRSHKYSTSIAQKSASYLNKTQEVSQIRFYTNDNNLHLHYLRDIKNMLNKIC